MLKFFMCFICALEFAGSEKLGLASKVPQNLWGAVGGFFSRFSTMQRVLAEPRRFCRISEGGLYA